MPQDIGIRLLPATGPDSTHNNSPDRILVLKIKDGTKPLSSTGLVDTKLFKGGNRLHAIMDTSNCLWHLEYDSGILPLPLRQQFTGFNKLLVFVKEYFDTRNIEIQEFKNA